MSTANAQPGPCKWIERGDDALQACKALAKKGDQDAQLALEKFASSKEDESKRFERIALQGRPQEIEEVRGLLWDRAERNPPSSDVLEFLLKVAKRSDLDRDTLVVTQAQICMIYVNGMGVPKDYKSAVYWCEQSTKNGGAKSAWTVIRAYKYGLGVPKDVKRAEILWQEFLTQQVLPIADRNPETVVGYYKDAAREGFCSASKQLADIYEKGLFKVTPSLETAEAWKKFTAQCLAVR